jgi:hypothetical protein
MKMSVQLVQRRLERAFFEGLTDEDALAALLAGFQEGSQGATFWFTLPLAQ